MSFLKNNTLPCLLENKDRIFSAFHLSFDIKLCWKIKPDNQFYFCNIVTNRLFFLVSVCRAHKEAVWKASRRVPWVKSVQDNRKQPAATEGETRILLRLSTRKSSSGFICTRKETDTKIPISQTERSELFLLILTEGAYASSESVCSFNLKSITSHLKMKGTMARGQSASFRAGVRRRVNEWIEMRYCVRSDLLSVFYSVFSVSFCVRHLPCGPGVGWTEPGCNFQKPDNF